MGFVLSFPFRENLQTALTEGLPVVQVYWGEFDRNLVDLVHSFGTKVIHQVKDTAQCPIAPDMSRRELRQTIPTSYPTSNIVSPLFACIIFAMPQWFHLTAQNSRELSSSSSTHLIQLISSVN